MIGEEFDGAYTLESNGDILYCLKSGEVKNVQTIFKKKCNDADYTSSIEFTYKDTVA